jgi:hypothetical protein
MSWPRALASQVGLPPLAVDLGFCFLQVLQYSRKSHHASLLLSPPIESQVLLQVPQHGIRQQHPTLAVGAGERSALVGAEQDGG